jgi:hypothetical protein
MDAELLLDCPVCGQTGPAETPPCFDDHDGACPDRICSRCGAGLLLNPFLIVPRRDVSHRGAA